MAKKITNAGYEIIAVEEYYKHVFDSKRDAIALGRMDTDKGPKFVTWEATLGQDEGGFTTYSFYCGHYFEQDKRAAYMDYHKRLYDRYNEG